MSPGGVVAAEPAAVGLAQEEPALECGGGHHPGGGAVPAGGRAGRSVRPLQAGRPEVQDQGTDPHDPDPNLT